MQELVDNIVGFASPWLSPLGALLATVIVGSLLFGLALGAVVIAAWFAFTRTFRFATGRAFVFTRKMAFVLSAVLGAILSVGYATKIFHAIVEGVITTHPRHGTPRVYYWFEDRSGFIWAIFDLAITAFGSWAIIAGALFKAAQWSSNQEAAKPPTPPTRTAPQ